MIREEIKLQKNAIKKLSKKEQWKHYWYYHKYHILATALILFLLIQLGLGILQQLQDKSIFVILVNSNVTESEQTDLLTQYVTSRQIDIQSHPAVLDVSIHIVKDAASGEDPLSITYSENNAQKLYLFLESDHPDVVIGDLDLLSSLSLIRPFVNLRDYLPSDLYERFEPWFVYATYEEDGTIPIAIQLQDCERLYQSSVYDEDTPVFYAIPVTAKENTMALDFLRYLYE